MAGVRDLRESIKIMDLDRCVCGNAITVKVRTLDFTLSGMGKNQKFLSRRLSCHDFGFKWYAKVDEIDQYTYIWKYSWIKKSRIWAKI